MTARSLYRLDLVLLLVYFGAAAALWPTLPDRIPIHFGLSGEPTRWVDATVAAWFGLPMVAAGLTLFVWWLGRLAVRYPTLWNLPDKERFLRLPPERRAAITDSLEAYVAQVAMLLIVLFAELQVEMYATAMGRTGGLSLWFWLILAIVVGGSLGGALALYARLGRRIREAEKREQEAQEAAETRADAGPTTSHA
jgi:uncharacterized membrane protein